MAIWQLQQAKAQLSEVVKMALEKEPQQITLHGKPAVVVLAQVEYDRLTKSRGNLVSLMRHSPFVGENLDLERDPSLTRDIDL
jgi:antitoxin Phd